MRCNLNNRALVHFPRIHQIVNNRKENNSGRDQDRPIHMRRVRIHRCWEETEDYNYRPIAYRECIEHNTQYPRDMKRPPNELVGLPGMATHLTRFSNIAADAAPKEEELGHGVGCVERRDADG